MAPGNPLGAQVVYDGETPRTFTAYARQAISGGEFVFVSGATGIVGSGTTSFNVGSVNIALCVANASTYVERANGLVLANAGSNTATAVLQRGAVIVKCGGSVFGGFPVELVSGTSVDSVQSVTSGAVPGGLFQGVVTTHPVGRGITDGASGGFALVYFNF